MEVHGTRAGATPVIMTWTRVYGGVLCAEPAFRVYYCLPNYVLTFSSYLQSRTEQSRAEQSRRVHATESEAALSTYSKHLWYKIMYVDVNTTRLLSCRLGTHLLLMYVCT